MKKCISDPFVKICYPEKEEFVKYFQENIEFESRHNQDFCQKLKEAEELFLREEYSACIKVLNELDEYQCFARAMEIHYE